MTARNLCVSLRAGVVPFSLACRSAPVPSHALLSGSCCCGHLSHACFFAVMPYLPQCRLPQVPACVAVLFHNLRAWPPPFPTFVPSLRTHAFPLLVFALLALQVGLCFLRNAMGDVVRGSPLGESFWRHAVGMGTLIPVPSCF